MESMRTESVNDGQAPMPSAQVVSKVLSQNTSNNTFLKNIGVSVNSKKSETSAEKAIKEQLAAANQVAANLHEQVYVLKKKCEDQDQVLLRAQKELEEFKKEQQENNQLLKRILMLNTFGNFSQP
jgi:molecular chaperone GrpE (heat shock protein)